MQIRKIQTQNISKMLSKTTTSPIKGSEHVLKKHALPNAALGISAAAVCGRYIAEKSAQNRDERLNEVKKLKLNDELNAKILNAKDETGNKIFDKNGLKLLSESANLKDSAFFSFIIKNIDYITKIDKVKNPSFDIEINTYSVKAKTPDGETGAKISVTDYGTIYNCTEFNEDGVPVTIERVCDDTITSEKKSVYFGEKESFTFDKFKQTLTTEKFDNAGKLVFSRTTSINKEHLIDNVFTRDFDNSDEEKIRSNTNVTDYQNDINIKVFEEKTPVRFNALSLVRTYKNPKTGRMETLKMGLSEVPGVYNSVIVDELGNKKTESLGKVNPDGSILVEKHLESLDGTTTNYKYTSSKDESDVMMHYDIKSKNGTPLTTVDRKFKRISPELAYSSINGRNYEIRNKDNAIEVKDDFTGETTVIPYDSFFEFEEDKEHRELLNKLSGDMLVDMYKRGYKYNRVEELYKSGMSAKKKEIEARDDVFTFAHEQGHTKDIISRTDADFDEKGDIDQNRIISNPEFRRVFKSERRQFRENFPTLEKEYISYFTESFKRGSEETVAETNALFSTGMPNPKGDLTRVYYLQKYFPRTIAVLSSLLNPNSNIYVGK